MRPPQIIALVFLAIILLGSALLCLPAASKRGEPTDFLTSLFTATSATCVTGLVRVDTGTYWSGFGQAVILVMIQIGGLGFMTIASIFFFALRRKIGLRQRLVLAQALSFDQISGVVGLVRNVLLGTLAVEGAGTIAVIDGVSFENAIYETISALCTVGLTTGITSGLSLASCLILIIFMFFGRVGIMTISVGFMMANPAEDRITYAQTRVMIG